MRTRSELPSEILLQSYSGHQRNLFATRVFGRAIALATITAFVSVPYLRMYALFAILATFTLVAVIWYYDQRSIADRLSQIEILLAQSAGPESEDFYIKARHVIRYSQSSFLNLYKMEPLMWLITVYILGLLKWIT